MWTNAELIVVRPVGSVISVGFQNRLLLVGLSRLENLRAALKKLLPSVKNNPVGQRHVTRWCWKIQAHHFLKQNIVKAQNRRKVAVRKIM